MHIVTNVMASESDCQQPRDKRLQVWSSQNERANSFFRKDYKDPKRPFCCQVKLRADDGEEPGVLHMSKRKHQKYSG